MFSPEVTGWAIRVLHGESVDIIPEELRGDVNDLLETVKILEELEATRARANTQEDR
jgi:hypothetical protein